MKKGFTLIELMVAVTILGLVLAVGTPPIARYMRHFQSKDTAQLVASILRQARGRAIHERNNYIAYFSLTASTITILDDDGGGGGNPAEAGFVPTNRGNGRADNGEAVYGPYELPGGQVFGLIGGSVGPDGTYVTSPVTFSGSPPRVIFYPNGSTNEEGLIFVMSNADFRAQKKGAERMIAVRRSTGTVILALPSYN